MVSSDLLDVVIGVVFAWFLLSLVVSLIGEALAWATKTRSKLLWRSVGQLFDAGVDAADARVRTLLIKSPLGADDIRPVARTAPSLVSEPRAKMATAVEGTGPSLAQQLYEIVRRRVPDSASGNWRTRISRIPRSVLGDAFETLAGRTVSRASLLASIAPDSALPAALGDLPDGALDQAALAQGLTPELQTELAAAWSRAEQMVTVEDLEALLAANPALLARVRAAVATAVPEAKVIKAREEIERWFDGAMDGLSTFYRRQNRKVLALIALPVVLFANSSAFGLFDRLQDDNNIRNAAATSAATWAAEPLGRTELGAVDLEEVCARIAATGTANPSPTADTLAPDTVPPETVPPASVPPDIADTAAPPTSVEPAPDVFAEVQRRFDCASMLFSSSELLTPFGPNALWNEIRAADSSNNLWNDLWEWRVSALGRVVTWLALLFGASFWYDALRRLIGLKAKAGGTTPSDR